MILCIFAGDIKRKKMRADCGMTYDQDAPQIIGELTRHGIAHAGVAIARLDGHARLPYRDPHGAQRRRIRRERVQP